MISVLISIVRLTNLTKNLNFELPRFQRKLFLYLYVFALDNVNGSDCVCVSACLHVCIYVCMYVSMYVCIYVCTYTHAHAHAHAHAYIYIYIQSPPKRLSCANIYKYINTDHVISTVCTNFNRNRSGSVFKFWQSSYRHCHYSG